METRAVRVITSNGYLGTKVLVLDAVPYQLPIGEWASGMVQRFREHLLQCLRLQ